jgi:hypothetical protein
MGVRFAVNNISKPLEELEYVKNHLDKMLTDENFTKAFGVTSKDIPYIPKTYKLYFTVSYITNPLCGIVKYVTRNVNPARHNQTPDASLPGITLPLSLCVQHKYV